MLSEKLDDWTEQWKKEGVEAGRKEGLKLGLERPSVGCQYPRRGI
ncbi:hypothetical protein [Marinimicrobium sp. ARAG 43.8]